MSVVSKIPVVSSAVDSFFRTVRGYFSPKSAIDGRINALNADLAKAIVDSNRPLDTTALAEYNRAQAEITKLEAEVSSIVDTKVAPKHVVLTREEFEELASITRYMEVRLNELSELVGKHKTSAEIAEQEVARLDTLNKLWESKLEQQQQQARAEQSQRAMQQELAAAVAGPTPLQPTPIMSQQRPRPLLAKPPFTPATAIVPLPQINTETTSAPAYAQESEEAKPAGAEEEEEEEDEEEAEEEEDVEEQAVQAPPPLPEPRRSERVRAQREAPSKSSVVHDKKRSSGGTAKRKPAAGRAPKKRGNKPSPNKRGKGPKTQKSRPSSSGGTQKGRSGTKRRKGATRRAGRGRARW